MENILPTELKIDDTGKSGIWVYIADETTSIIHVNPQYKEVVELMVKLYNEYMKNGSGWISVEERLPEITINQEKDINNSESVIAMLKNGEIYKMMLSHWYEDNPENFNWVFSDSYEICYSVAKWMPIPPSK